jgi:HSP20 family protein
MIAPLIRFDNLFDAVWAAAAADRATHRTGSASPFALRETEDAWELRAVLPGVKAEEVQLDVTADQIRLVAERTLPAPDGFVPVRRERTGFRFERSFEPPSPIDPDRVEAKLERGVLTVKLPKAAAAVARKITVQAG